MTQSTKDKILSAAIGGGFSLIVALLVSFTAFKRDGNVQIMKDVETLKELKADKTELESKINEVDYEADQSKRWKAHDLLEAEKEKRQNDMYEMIKEIRFDVKELNKKK